MEDRLIECMADPWWKTVLSNARRIAGGRPSYRTHGGPLVVGWIIERTANHWWKTVLSNVRKIAGGFAVIAHEKAFEFVGLGHVDKVDLCNTAGNLECLW